MQARALRIVVSVAALTALMVGAAAYLNAGAGVKAVHAQSLYSKLSKQQKLHLSGFLSSEFDPAAQRASAPVRPLNYFPTSQSGCSQNLAGNIKVNQNCLNLTDPNLQGRGQAQNETSIAQDPLHPNNLIASSNDYRRGDGNCYSEYSRDQGQHWTDSTIPIGFTSGANFGGVPRQYWQAGGDTSVAWDT